MVEDLVPIFICCVLPIAIVLIVSLVKINADRQRSNIIIKAIEANNEIDADKLAESLKKPQRTPLQILNLRLLRGCIFTLIGIGLVICGIVANNTEVEFGEDPVLIPIIAGSLSLAVGISYLIVFFVTRSQVNTITESEI
ncbi:MAG: hypothetical protein K2N05_02320 [Muribaculaceae bacterium]|nr:hypothetical protein [Muribaculaceae bacterium]